MQDKEDNGSTKSKEEKKKPGEWSKEDMEKAEPYPLPELDEDEEAKDQR